MKRALLVCGTAALLALAFAATRTSADTPTTGGGGMARVVHSADFDGSGTTPSPLEMSSDVTMPGKAFVAGVSGTSTVTVNSTNASGITSTHTQTAGTTDDKAAFYGTSTGTLNTTAGQLYNYGVRGRADSTRSSGANDVNNWGTFGVATGGQKNIGSIGWALSSAAGTEDVGILGLTDSVGTSSYGLRGVARGAATTNYAVYGTSSGAGTNYSGYFDTGSFRVQGAATLNSSVAINDDATFESGTCVINSAGITCGGTLITPGADITAVTAGAGLTGGGTSGAVTLDIGAGTGITVNANDIAVNLAGASCSAGQFLTALSATGTGTCSSTAISGTSNTMAKFTGTNVIGNSSLTDSGTALASSSSLTLSGTGPTNILSFAPVYSGVILAKSSVNVQPTGTFDGTTFAANSYGVFSSVTTTRSAGANAISNRAIYGNASGAQTNYSGYFDVGSFHVGGAADFGSTLDVTGNVAVNTNKFTVAASTGNTLVAGTLSATGDVAVNTNKFNVTAASGNTAIAGTLAAVGDFAINTNKFTVAASSGNTAVAGTLDVTSTFTVATTATADIKSNLRAKFFSGDATTPTPTCGTGPTIDPDSNNLVGKLAAGTGTGGSCSIAYNGTWPTRPWCHIETAAGAAIAQTAITVNNTTTLTWNAADSTTYYYWCTGGN